MTPPPAVAAPQKKAKTPADRLTQAGVKVSRVYQTVLMDPADLTLIRDPKHPLFDPRVNDPVDPNSTRYQEILAAGAPHTAIKARENGMKDGKPIVQVIDGRDRTQILQHINEHHPLESGPRKLKVDLVHGDDGEMVLLSLSANGHKAETPYSLAVKIGKAEKCGQSLEEIARACGWATVLPVKKHLAILNFVPKVQAAFHGEEALSLAAAGTFAKVPREEQEAALEKVQGGGAKKAREVEAAVQASQQGTEYVPPAPRKRIWSPERVERLVLAIGTGEAAAILRHITGDPDALKDHPTLQAAVEKMSKAEAA
jgi:ParB family chromosome partitioning protein